MYNAVMADTLTIALSHVYNAIFHALLVMDHKVLTARSVLMVSSSTKALARCVKIFQDTRYHT